MAVMQTQLLSPNEPGLGCLCITQALEPCAGTSSWGRAINLQEDCPGITERGCEPEVPQQPQHR